MQPSAHSSIPKPKCSSCGGHDLTFQEIFGPPSASTYVQKSHEGLIEEETRIVNDLLKLEEDFQRELEKLEKTAAEKIARFNAKEKGEIQRVESEVELEATAAKQDDVMQYLIGDKEKDRMRSAKLAQFKEKLAADRQELQNAIAAARQTLTNRLASLRTQLRTNLEYRARAFVDVASSYSIAVVYCKACGQIVSSVPSPRISAGLSKENQNSIIQCIREASDAQLQRFDVYFNRIDELQRTTIHAAEQVIVRMNALGDLLARLVQIERREESRETWKNLGNLFSGPGNS